MFLYSILLAAPPLMLLALGLIPSRWANRHVEAMRSAAVAIMTIALTSSVAAALMLAVLGPLDVACWQFSWPIATNIGVYFDTLSAAMLLLICFIGLIIVRYSLRYLDSEPTQGRFLRWMMFTLGAVLSLIISRNLVMFTAAWMMTSWGLHQLLVHYPDRSWAIWAARKKFLISRLGDTFLIVALVLTYHCFGSFDYAVVFGAASAAGAGEATTLMSLIGALYVLGAMTKSAQFPFHTWLPDTMETPTPVSALMHAGIINAGGFLIIRLSPLVSSSGLALDLLAIVGAFTAVFAGVVMLTQTSVKRSLAYSTIAQMGFMMLQCGLGAYSLALLHIVAHSLYKAHAFLSSGSVLDTAASMVSGGERPARRPALGELAVAFGVSSLLIAGAAWQLGIDYLAKPGGSILGLILLLALTHSIWPALSSSSWKLAWRGIAAASVVCMAYFAAYLATDRLLSLSVSYQEVSTSAFDFVVLALVAGGFLAVFVLQTLTHRAAQPRWLPALYVHAMHGFYIDIPARRLTALFWGRSIPAP